MDSKQQPLVEVATNPVKETRSRKPRRKRPDGMALDRYHGLEKWSYRRWAWEFLRRNERFQLACDQVDTLQNPNDEKIKIAAEFGLKKYKPYKEAYNGESGRPCFTTGNITSWTQFDCEDGVKHVRVSLDKGQVLIRFDLASSLEDVRILQKQILAAEARLKKRLKSYESKINKEAQVRRHKVGTFGQYLRLLDLQAAGKTQLESGLLVAPKKARRLKSKQEIVGKEDFAPAINKKINRAIEYANELYRYLAVLKGRPFVKCIPLEQ